MKRKASTSLSIYSLRVERSGQFFFFMLAHLHSFKKAPQPAKGIKTNRGAKPAEPPDGHKWRPASNRRRWLDMRRDSNVRRKPRIIRSRPSGAITWVKRSKSATLCKPLFATACWAIHEECSTSRNLIIQFESSVLFVSNSSVATTDRRS